MATRALLRVSFFLICSSGCRHHVRLNMPRGGATFAHGVLVNIMSANGGTGMGSNRDDTPEGRQSPRIMTLLTTYHKRTAFARANRETMKEREDGYESLMFITSDDEDQDEYGTVDFNYGLPHNHRLLGAITEAYRRHKGEFEWMAIGDDDTVFLYNRAKAFLSHIDHTQPVAIGSVDGLHPKNGRPRANASCFSPQEKNSTTADTAADKGCCLDFTHPCKVPAFPTTTSPTPRNRLRPTWFKTEGTRSKRKDRKHHWTREYGKGGMFWPYGGSGMFLSAGMLESVQQSGGGAGWERCTQMFGIGYDTDIQLGMCLRVHGLSTSTYPEGFDRTCGTADPDEIEDRLAENCQVLGIHLGIRHLENDTVYTPEAFKSAASAAHREDKEWASPTDLYMEEACPSALRAISKWENPKRRPRKYCLQQGKVLNLYTEKLNNAYGALLPRACSTMNVAHQFDVDLE